MNKVRFHERLCPLVVPAHRLDYAEDLLSVEEAFRPDCVVFDLEDTVAEANRENARNELEKLFALGSPYRRKFENIYPGGFMLRVNRPGSAWFDDDLRFATSSAKPDYLLLSKIEEAAQLELITGSVGESIELVPLIETLPAYKNRDAIMRALPKEGCCAIGYEDLSAELGIDRPERLDSPSPISHILNECLISAATFGIYLYDGLSRRFKTQVDIATVRTESEYTKSIGVWGKFAIHPTQVPVIRTVFDRSVTKEWARDTVERYRAASRRGSGSFLNESGQMEDTPSFRRAQKILKRWREQADKG